MATDGSAAAADATAAGDSKASVVPAVAAGGGALIQAGQSLPQILVRYKHRRVDFAELLKTQRIVIFGVTGAFAPVCTEVHMKGLRDNLPLLLASGVACVVVLSVNDPFVLNAWSEQLRLGDDVIFMADPHGTLTKSLGLFEDMSDVGLGFRCRRSAIIAGPGNCVQWVGLDGDAYASVVLRAVRAMQQERGSVAEFLESQPVEQPATTSAEPLSPAALAQLEWEIRGPPRRGSAAVVKYELKRSQCNLLADTVDDDEEDDDEDKENSAEDDDSEEEEDDGYGKFLGCYDRVLAAQVPRHIGERHVNLAEDAHDITIRFEVPSQCLFKRVKNEGSDGVHDPQQKGDFAANYSVTLEPFGNTAGHISRQKVRYFLREVQFLSPAQHHRFNPSSQLVETPPLELRLLLASDLVKHGGDKTRLAVICIPVVWDTTTATRADNTASTLIQQLAEVCKHMEAEDEQEKMLECTDVPLDLSMLLAGNTLSAYFHYVTNDANQLPLKPKAHPDDAAAAAQMKPLDDECAWLVSRGAVAVPLRDVQALGRIMGSDNFAKLAVASGVDSALHSVLSPPTAAVTGGFATGSPSGSADMETVSPAAVAIGYEQAERAQAMVANMSHAHCEPQPENLELVVCTLLG